METPGAIWTAEQLCVLAAADGVSCSPRLIRDWGDVGLIDRPPISSRGRHGVVPTTWPDNQRMLFVLELRKRAEGAPIAALCKLPVFLWLQYGDDYVPLRQVRRAIATWAEAASHPAAIRALRVASQTAAALSHPEAGPRIRRRFRDTIARGQAGERLEFAELLRVTRAAFDPADTGQSRGPAGATMGPEDYARMVDALVRTAAIIIRDRKGSEIADDAFEVARRIYRETRRGYVFEWQRFARDPELGHLHVPPTADEVVNAACRDLLELLALGLMKARGWRWSVPERPR